MIDDWMIIQLHIIMMKKNRTIYFLLALVCLGLQSCLFQEEDYFDDSSANRATADVKRCSELLEAAPNGWVMEYYVGKDYSLGGITLLCKFDGQRVTMASQIAGADETVSSLYSVKSEQATMLSFDTYNYLVHYFGQPQGSMADDPNGTLGGDYEFVISDATADRIWNEVDKIKRYVKVTNKRGETKEKNLFFCEDLRRLMRLVKREQIANQFGQM